jgi:hypothetical protein
LALTKSGSNFEIENLYVTLPPIVLAKRMKIIPYLHLILLLLLLLCSVGLPAQPNMHYRSDLSLLPIVFNKKFPCDISLDLPENTLIKSGFIFSELQNPVQFHSPSEEYISNLRTKAYRDFIRNNITYVKYVESDFPNETEVITEIRSTNIFDVLFSVEPEKERTTIDQSTRFRPKRRYWQYGGSSLLQFSQNYLSENWFNGGVGNLNLISVQSLTFNYKKNKIQFNHLIEWKLSFYTNPKDTLRAYRIGDDLIRTYTDLGLKAFNDKFSYSSNLEIKTKFFKSFKENSHIYNAAFLSPLQINVGILGMKYQLDRKSKIDKYRKLNLSVDVSLFSAQYTWVADADVMAQNRYGIKPDENYLLDLGSTVNAKLVYNFNRQIVFSSRLKYFTNYEKTIVESENELNISLNRFFSTRIYFYGRFDDTPGIKQDPRWNLLQMNELLSFGFNYKW